MKQLEIPFLYHFDALNLGTQNQNHIAHNIFWRYGDFELNMDILKPATWGKKHF